MKKLMKWLTLGCLTTLPLMASASYTTVHATVNVKSACEKNAEQNMLGDIGIGKTDKGFSSCNIFTYENNQYVEISPVVAKFNQGESAEINTDYVGNAPVDSSDWRFSSQNDTNWNFADGQTTAAATTSGSWRYSDDNGIHIRYWAIKAGAQEFNLFWKVSNDDYAAYCSASGTFNLACLTAAITTDNGTWHSPSNGNNTAQLSNITFFNSKNPVNVTTSIPEPSMLMVFLLGLLGLTLRRKA